LFIQCNRRPKWFIMHLFTHLFICCMRHCILRYVLSVIRSISVFPYTSARYPNFVTQPETLQFRWTCRSFGLFIFSPMRIIECKKDLYRADIVNEKSIQRRGGWYFYVHHEYATVGLKVFSVWQGSLTANWGYECHSVLSSRRSEPPRRTLAWLSQRVSTAQRDASSLGVHRCTANGSRQSLMRVDRYFVLDALLDRQPVKRL